jgi:hypothetical protein
MQLVYTRELILKRASPLFFNGPAASEAVSGSSLAALASSVIALVADGDRCAWRFHRPRTGVAGRVSRLRMTSANVDRIMTLRGRAGR